MMMGMNSGIGGLRRSEMLPPTNVRKNVRESKDWQMAMMDGFERIAQDQFVENLKFTNFYRMVEGKMSYQELSEVIPHLDNLQDILNGVGIPTFLKHYDLIGVIVNLLVGKYIDIQDKFHVTDTGEIATNEFLRNKSQEVQELLTKLMENEVQIHLAENGLDPNSQQFASEAEQQQFLQQLQQTRDSLMPKDTENDSQKSFKTLGVQWGEATMDMDRIRFNLLRHEKKEFRDKFLTGRCFREYKITGDTYYPVTWSPKNTFIPKEIETDRVQDGEYAGRFQLYSPAECINRHGHAMSAKEQTELMGGNKQWKNFVSDYTLGDTGSFEQALTSNFNKPVSVPFGNYPDYLFMTQMEDNLNYPLATYTSFNNDGTQTDRPSYIPRYLGSNHGQYSMYAKILNDNFEPRLDYCQATEVYFRGYELWGYLTYETETGLIVTEEVTEDILDGFLEENNIKQKFTEVVVEEYTEDSFPLNTIIWTWKPACYEGVKIQSPNLKKPLYLYCRRCKHQIKGESEFDIKLPVAGYVGKAEAPKIEPYQAKYNLCMNQLYSLLEKEVGTFFLMDVQLIPSQFAGYGDARQSLMELRTMAKDIGILPIATGEDYKNDSPFNQFSTYDISFGKQMSSRIELAEFYQRKAFQVIGADPVQMAQMPKYTTASGVQISNNISLAQIAEIYEDFGTYVQGAWELHLSVAQYCQSNNKDITLYYTKSDASLNYLKITDPEFPLRRIGVIPAVDSVKRKELEEFKEYLKNNNVIGSDTMEMAKLFASDSMQEIVEISKIERKNRQKEELEKHNRDQSLIDQQAQKTQELQDQQWEKDEITNQRDRDNRVDVAAINAAGRAADKHSDSDGFNQITKQRELALKDKSLDYDQEKNVRDFQLRDKSDSDKRELAWQKFNKDVEEMKLRREKMASDQAIAALNKN